MSTTLPQAFKSNTAKVYKNKKLNNANFGDFNLNDYQVFLHLITKIKGKNKAEEYLEPESLEREYTLTANEFSEIFNTDLSYSYKLLYKACKKLMKTSITLQKIELNETWEVNVCSMAKYNENHGSITVMFTDSIMPYLSQVKEKFVLYNIKEIANFGSIYTTRLYELIQEFKETGWLLKSVEQLREIFAVGNKFKTYNNLKQRTFGHACKEINDNYDIGLKFEEIKKDRRVVAVKFFFKKTIIHKVINDKTGSPKNFYTKPQRVLKLQTNLKNGPSEDLINEPRSLKNIVSSIFSKFTKK